MGRILKMEFFKTYSLTRMSLFASTGPKSPNTVCVAEGVIWKVMGDVGSRGGFCWDPHLEC